AALAVGKVLSDQGSGSESQIIAGMEWAARDVRARIVSMSLGSQEPSDGTDPMAQAVNTLTKETGALFVVAAGNTGAPSAIGSPGAADAALTVGAVDSADRPAYFTSAGPRLG
ncbi:S8 family serine peptidase, partial [Amycolatopsis sp. KNN50.9b]